MPTSQTLAILSAPEDAPFVAQLRADLIAADYTITDIASERLHEDPCSEPGELRRRLEPAQAILVVLSPQAAQSEQVRCEIEFARLLEPSETTRRLIPVLISATDVPYSVRNLHTIYFTAGPYDAALARLKAHLASVASADAPEYSAIDVAPNLAAAATIPLPTGTREAESARSSAIASMPTPSPADYTPPVPVAPVARPFPAERARAMEVGTPATVTAAPHAPIAPQPEPPTQPLPPRAPVPEPALTPAMATPAMPAPAVATPTTTPPPLAAQGERIGEERLATPQPKRRPFWRALFERK